MTGAVIDHPTSDQVWAALSRVTDPEIQISLLDLGVLHALEPAGQGLRIVLFPTRLGCPGRLEMSRRLLAVAEAVAPGQPIELDWRAGVWTPALITTDGRRQLAEVGYAVPDAYGRIGCPYCGSTRVRRVAAFGASVCARPFHCPACGSAFDQLAGAGCPKASAR